MPGPTHARALLCAVAVAVAVLPSVASGNMPGDGRGAARRASSSNRTVTWWLADYNTNALAENTAFLLAQPRSSVSSVFHCCSGPTLVANGSFVPNQATEQLYQQLAAAERRAGVAGPVLIALSPAPDAVLAGVAGRSIPALVALAQRADIDGFVLDYEPHDNTTEQHAQVCVRACVRGRE